MSRLSPKDIEALARDVTADTATPVEPLTLTQSLAEDVAQTPSRFLAAGLGIFEPVCAAVWLGKASWAFGFVGIQLGLLALSASFLVETKAGWITATGLLIGFRLASAIWAYRTADHVAPVAHGDKWGRGWATVAAIWVALMAVTGASEGFAGKVVPTPIPAAFDTPDAYGPGVARIYPAGKTGGIAQGDIVLWVDTMGQRHFSRVTELRKSDYKVELATGGSMYVAPESLYGRVLFRFN